MFDTLGTTSSITPTTTYTAPTTSYVLPTATACGSTYFTLNDDGTIDKKHLSTVAGTYATTTSTYAYSNYQHDAVLRKYANAEKAERYVESLSDEELEVALQKLGVLEDELVKESVTKTI